ncbi:MAG: DUF4339 domain-containing protein [Planctomycetota bacterium]
MEALVIQLLVMGVFGVIVSMIAGSRGRNAVGWFFIGAFFPCIGLILVLVLPDMKVQSERHERMERENQRLKERLRKDRQTADQRHSETVKRLGAHDAVLGLDTSAPEPAASIEATPAADALPPRRAAAASRGAGSALEGPWHYAAHEDAPEVGPVSLDELRARWNEGALFGTSQVWRKGLQEWVAIDTLSDLREELNRG